MPHGWPWTWLLLVEVGLFLSFPDFLRVNIVNIGNKMEWENVILTAIGVPEPSFIQKLRHLRCLSTPSLPADNNHRV